MCVCVFVCVCACVCMSVRMCTVLETRIKNWVTIFNDGILYRLLNRSPPENVSMGNLAN